MQDRLHRRPFIVQFLFDNWIYIAIGILMWQLPNILENYYNNPISGFENSRDLVNYIRRNGPNDAINRLALFNGFYIVAILAMGYNLAFGFAGIISFGHALFFGSATYIVIILVEDYSKTIETSAVSALLVGVLFGLILSIVVLRIKGVYFAMFTLALSEIFFELSTISIFKFLTNGEDGRQFVSNRPELASAFARLDLYELCALSAAGVFILIKVLMASRIGKVIVAIRENEERARTMGYNVALYKTIVMVLSCSIASLAGFLYALDAGSASPTATLGVGRTIEPLLMTIIGGTGTIPGPAVGAAILHLGEDIFRKPDLYIDFNFIVFRYQDTVDTVSIWPVVLGTMFIVIVLLIPFGLIGQLNKLWLDIRHWVRTYLYDPVILQRPELAKRMRIITGESPGLAQGIAERSANKTLGKWVREYPISALLSTVIVLALMVGVATQDQRRGFSIFLFLMLISTPGIVAYLLYRNQQSITDYVERLRDSINQTFSR